MESVLWWHLHQPDYRDPLLDEARLPWVRMHALRAYTDLVTVAQEDGLCGMTLNLVPSLMDQLQDLGQGKNEDRHLKTARRFLDGDDRAQVDAFFLHAVPTPKPLLPLPHFEPLRQKAARGEPPSKQEAVDAIVLFHLSWVGFTVGRDPRVEELFKRQRNYDVADAHYLLGLSSSTCAWVLPRMRNACDEGVLHLSCTPYFHPILPLVYDGQSAARCTTVQKPIDYKSPQTAALHVEQGCQRFEQVFGTRPRAMWPGEGSLSEEVLPLFADAGVEVVASDEELLRKSIDGVAQPQHAHWHPYQHDDSGLKLLFRDRRLSDDWGFVYRDMSPTDAADAFLGSLKHKEESGAGVCAIILDGENPFEQYPMAGRDHLRAIANHKHAVRWVHPAEVQAQSKPLARLATGSWIHASFDIWAGDEEDREAWAMLHHVKQRIDMGALDDDRESRVRTHLMAAEGSDWFWWYGPEFSTIDREHFDALFRGHLTAAVLAAGLDAKDFPALKRPIEKRLPGNRRETAFPGGHFTHGMSLLSLDADTAEEVGASEDGGAMHRADPLIRRVLHRVHDDGHDFLVALRPDVERAELQLLDDDIRIDLDDGWRDVHANVQLFCCTVPDRDVVRVDVVATADGREERLGASPPLARQQPTFFEA